MTQTELLVAIAMGTPIAGGALAGVLRGRASDLVALTAGLTGCTAALILAVLSLSGPPLTGWGDVVRIDALSGWTVLIVITVAVVAIAASVGYLDHAATTGHLRRHDRGLYWALLLWFLGGLIAVPLTDNLGLVWVAVEATTIIAALLVGFARTPGAIEAAWKALILGSVGVGFALLGTLLAYASSIGSLGETSDALSWSRLMVAAPGLDPGLIRLSFVFALVGYGTKAGLAPFHTWLPDAHSQAPAPVSAVLSGAALATAFYALARFHLVAVSVLGEGFSSAILVAVGLLSLLIAVPFVVAQGDLKRLLAYSSIEHLGLVTLALGFGGTVALAGLTLHLLAHGMLKASLFVSGGGLVEVAGSYRIGRMRGSLERAPADGRAFVGGSVLLSGLPPSALFVTELAIVIGGVQAGQGWAAALAALLLAVTAGGFLFHVVHVATGSAPGRPRESGAHRRRLRAGVALVAPLVVVGVLGLWTPIPVDQAIRNVVAVLAVAR